MDDNLSDLEKRVLDCRQVKGYTVEETLKELSISRKVFKDTINKLIENNIYNEELVKKAMKNKKERIYTKKNKNRPKLSSDEEEYRKKCIDIMCKKYFDYEKTKNFNPTLVRKIQGLHGAYSYKVIFNTIKLQERNLDYANSKIYGSEYQKISYMIAIIRNNLNSVWKKVLIQEKIQDSLNKKDNSELINNLNRKIVTRPTSKIDMSEFLDD